VLNGHKAMISNAFEADVANLLAVTDPGQGVRSLTYNWTRMRGSSDR